MEDDRGDARTDEEGEDLVDALGEGRMKRRTGSDGPLEGMKGLCDLGNKDRILCTNPGHAVPHHHRHPVHLHSSLSLLLSSSC